MKIPWHKISIATFILIYIFSYILQNLFFVDWKVHAESTGSQTNLVAVIIDQDIYQSIKSDVQWYTTNYIQKQISNSKAILLPINVKNFKAPDIVKILENIYFDWIKGSSSKLLGLVLIGDIPLPVIKNNDFIYPSIYPYVDFENQQFIYDSNSKFFIPNDNANWQAEIRHSIINFDSTKKYNDFFNKLKWYDKNPENFIWKNIRYDDFIALKKYFLTDNVSYYINNLSFSEDINYHRFSNLLLNTLKWNYNENISQIWSDLNNLSPSDWQEIKDYAKMINDKAQEAKKQSSWSFNVPTLLLKKSTEEFIKTYDGLISTRYLSYMKDNVQTAWRRYKKNSDGNRVDAVDSDYEKIVQRDNWILGDSNNWVSPLLIQLNNFLESWLNQKIENEKYYMTIPVVMNYKIEERKINPGNPLIPTLPSCESSFTYYRNYYFGKYIWDVSSLQNLSLFQWTFQNLQSLSWTKSISTTKSIWSSYNVSSQQVQADRWYNILNAQNEIDLRNSTKIKVNWKEKCKTSLSWPWIYLFWICFGEREREAKKWDCADYAWKEADESTLDFAIRNRWWHSSINIDTGTLTLNLPAYDIFASYQHARLPIQDIAWSKNINKQESESYSYSMLNKYSSLIKVSDQWWDISYPRCIQESDQATVINWIPFVKKYIYQWVTDFFNLFSTWTASKNNNIISLIKEEWGCSTLKLENDYKKQSIEYKLIDSRLYNISPTPDQISWMNMMTQSRPIDNIRNITFKWIWWETVQLNYPDLYKVNVYKKSWEKLILKTPSEIRESIKYYLRDKAKEYSDQLQIQLNKKTAYYQTNSSAFSFLWNIDTSANPNRVYNIIDSEFFINKLIESLDNLESIYWHEYIYWDITIKNSDDKLNLIAQLFYYQNLPRQEKLAQTQILKDLQENKNSVDINSKILDTTKLYLTQSNDKWSFLSPTYNSSWYEVTYINSDWSDYISSKPTPSFIQQLQTIQEDKVETNANSIQMAQSISQTKSAVENEISSECLSDPSWDELIFDIKNFSSPRWKAMKCRAEKTFSQSPKIKVSFSNSLWPVLTDTYKQTSESIENRSWEIHEFGSQWSTTDAESKNQAMIDNSSEVEKTKLNDIENFVTIQTDWNFRLNDTKNSQIQIWSDRDLWRLDFTISATWSNCIWIGWYSSNLCTIPIKTTFNPYQGKNLDILISNKKAWDSQIRLNICLLNTKRCIEKNLTITFLANPVSKISVQKPSNILIQWWSIPIRVQWYDNFWNALWQVVENYQISVNAGDWEIFDGNQSSESTTFNHFNQEFIYTAPSNIVWNRTILINISWTNQDGKNINISEKLLIVKWILTINQWNQIIYKSNQTPTTISYTLPSDQSEIISSGQKVNETRISKISLTLQDNNWNKLDSVANITTQKGLLIPWSITNKKFSRNWNFIIKDWKLENIYLYPNFQAGNDILIINIPWFDPINIPLNIIPWSAKKINLTTDGSNLSDKAINGTLQVLDNWNNVVSSPTKVKIWSIWPALINGQESFEITFTWSDYKFQVTNKLSWWEWYVFAYIQNLSLEDQTPWYQKFISQWSFLPKEKLNTMYLSLFWTDRWNQRWYFSENNKVINDITSNSDKLLATTTQIIDPSKIKQIQVIVDENWQVQNMLGKDINLDINSDIHVNVQDLWKIYLWKSNSFSLQKIESWSDIQDIKKNTIFYIPEQTDSTIKSNIVKLNQIIINGNKILDLTDWSVSTDISIQLNDESINWYSAYNVLQNDKLLWKLIIYTQDLTTDNIAKTDLVNPIKYSKNIIFAEWSTNWKKWIWIYDTQSTFSKDSYPSIEDSADTQVWIWFKSNFKNITYFADWKSVWESTLPYWSQFLINFWDPLIKRTNKNIEIGKTELDGWIWDQIFSSPDKTIFKVTPIDFNNDWLSDLLVAYTDWTLKLLKNYWWTHPYKDLQELMIIADSIKEIKIGDVDGNWYDDILIWTNWNKLKIYKNKVWIFDVDGNQICLNTNIDEWLVTINPESLVNVSQLFFEDMNKDGKLDIITNDSLWDIKIFYWWSDRRWNWNYISILPDSCDSDRYTRQKDNFKIVKSLWIKINENRYVQDNSLLHRKWMLLPEEQTDETETEVNAPDATGSQVTMQIVKKSISNLDDSISEWARDLSYVQNPTEILPSYEANLKAEDIYYLPMTFITGSTLSVYKKYTNLTSSWALQNKDQVLVKTTIISLKNNNKITYIDDIVWPRIVTKNPTGKLDWFYFKTWDKTSWLKIYRWPSEDYPFMIDNITLNNWESLNFYYKLTYQQPAVSKIEIQDEDLDKNKKDNYLDIIINSNDACQKWRTILFNTKNKWQNNKEYQSVFDDVQDKMNNYLSGAKTVTQDTLNSTLDDINSVSSSNISSLPWISEITEWRDISKTLFNATQWWISLNINTNFIDSATAGVSEKIDSVLDGLCQWFKVSGKGSCQWIPVPFNQAFLAPWKYHLFWCIKLPLWPLEKWIPILSFPTSTTPFIWPPNPSWAWGIFWNTPPTSQFRLYMVPTLTLWMGIAICLGPYSVWWALPKPFRDMWWNCIVFALPPLTNCWDDKKSWWTTIEPEITSPNLYNASKNWTCNNPAKIWNSIVFDESSSSNKKIESNTSNSPFQIVSVWANNNPTTLIPWWTFGWLVQFSQKPTTLENDESSNLDVNFENSKWWQDSFNLKAGEKINLKVVWWKVKWLVKCIIQDWMSRQIQYIMNNLTKMTIDIRLPEVSQIFQWFDKIWSFSQIYNQRNQQDQINWNIQNLSWRKQNISTQQLKNQSQKFWQNPFEAIASMFNEVPLININTKDISVKVPAITSEDIDKYKSYIKIRLNKNEKVLNDRKSTFSWTLQLMTKFCGSSGTLEQLRNKNFYKSELEKMQKLWTTTGKNYNEIAKKVKQNEICLNLTDSSSSINSFFTFSENSAELIRSIRENIKVIEQYRQFPTQLYQWTHITDRYLTEISSILSDFVFKITYWLNTNATRFSKYVDAIVLIIWAIKSRQAIISFSTDWSEKCSKCSNDDYSSFSCSLSFLCPKLPILPIPQFKIPNIILDLSHIDLWISILLPKFNFVPIKIPLPQIPDLPEPPTYNINISKIYELGIDSLDIDELTQLMKSLNFGFAKDLTIPTVPILPSPPNLPELPSFIPSIEFDLPVLPPAPRIPKISPSIQWILKIAKFIWKVFCIIKWWIGLVWEKWVKWKVEQITQRTRNVPIFDYFDLTSKSKQTPLQWFDYKIDAYLTLKYNFDWVYNVLDNIVQTVNNMTSEYIETPIQQTVWQVTDIANNNPVNDAAQTIGWWWIPGLSWFGLSGLKLNFNSLPEYSWDSDYNTEYQKLKSWLTYLRSEAQNDKKTFDQANNILAIINTPANVNPTIEKIKNIENQAQTIIHDKQKEIQAIESQIQNDYPWFIKDIINSDIKLVKDDDKINVTLSSPIFAINPSTKAIIANQDNPAKTYLEINKWMVDGYLDALNNDWAEKLNMNQITYDNSKNYLEKLSQKINETLPAFQKNSNSKILLADNSCPTCSSNNESQTNWYSPDLSSYVAWTLIQSYSWSEKSMVNVINSQTQSDLVKDNIVQTDLNNDWKSDLLMRDTNNIYIKYAKQNSIHTSKWWRTIWKFYSNFYSYPAINSPEKLKADSNAWYIDFNGLEVKVTDENREVKNFKTIWQSFDTLQFSRKNSKLMWDSPAWYIIKLNNRVDTNSDKNEILNLLDQDIINMKYILILPDWVDYATWILSVDNISKRPIKFLLTWTVLSVEHFNPDQDDLWLVLHDLPRKRQYVQIATLAQDEVKGWLFNTTRYAFYSVNSPRSNQTVAGSQILGDNDGPVAEITLHRNITNENVWTWNNLDWFISTQYSLNALWTDNVSVKEMIIEQDWELLFIQTWVNQTWFISIPYLLFTWETQQNLTFSAMDWNWNISNENVVLNIATPSLKITDLKKIDDANAQIIAELSNDVDEWNVVFQRLRNNIWTQLLSGTNANKYGWFSLSPKQTVITWWVFKIWKTIWLYSPEWNEIWSLNPDNWEIKIDSKYSSYIKLNLDFALHIPTIKIIDTNKNQTLFWIVLPTQGLVKIDLNQGKPNYEIINLTQKNFGNFQWWSCIKNIDNECMTYINSLWDVYMPGIYASSLLGEYKFDQQTKNVQYIIKDQSGKNIATISVKIKPLAK